LLAFASAVTQHSLSEITGVVGTITVTATFPDPGATPVLATFTYPTTYDSSAAVLANFPVAGTATFTGNNTVVGSIMTLSNGGQTIQITQSINGLVGKTSSFASSGTVTFLNTGAYSVTVEVFTVLAKSYSVTLASGAFPTVAATAYVPLTVTAFNLVNPQSGGCDATACTNNINGTVTLSAAKPNLSWQTFLRSSNAATGVLFATGALVSSSTGSSNFNTDTFSQVTAYIGGMDGGVFSGAPNPGNTVVTKNDIFALSGQIGDGGRATYISESTLAAKQASVQFNAGGTDTMAPTCTVVSFASATVTTIADAVNDVLTLTCADEAGGSGLWTKGIFATVQVTSGGGATSPYSQVVTGATYTLPVPPYVSGTYTITGVFAVDNAGNAALYGNCGQSTGYDTICGSGGGSSSASTVTLSIFSLVVLTIVALFA
jgi:hypothetical protein